MSRTPLESQNARDRAIEGVAHVADVAAERDAGLQP